MNLPYLITLQKIAENSYFDQQPQQYYFQSQQPQEKPKSNVTKALLVGGGVGAVGSALANARDAGAVIAALRNILAGSAGALAGYGAGRLAGSDSDTRNAAAGGILGLILANPKVRKRLLQLLSKKK
jgi:ammonia channel protein AmtB